MKIGVIGAGNWGGNIVRNLNDLGALAAIADTDEGIRSRIEEEYPGVGIASDYAELLDAGLDAAAIVTPAPTHHGIAKAFLEHGIDVFVEKPMTLTPEDAEDLAKTAEENGRILMVGHLLLYQPAIQWIKRFIEGGNLGRIFSLHQQRAKLGRARAVENVVWSLGVHDVSVLLHLAGQEPTSVQFTGHACLRPGIADDAYLHMEFESGLKAHLHNSWLWPEERRRLTVIGEKGMLVYDEIAQRVVLHRKTIDANLENCDDGEEIVCEGSSQPLRLELEHFIECVRTRATPISDGRNGLAVIRVLEQALGESNG